jgi:phosphoglycolate phosphatase
MIETMIVSSPSPHALQDKCAGIRGLLFDKDGTLLDYHASWGPVNIRAADFAAKGDPALASHLLEIAGVDRSTGRAVTDSVISAGTTIDIAETWIGGGAPFDRESLVSGLDRLFFDAAADMVPVTDLPALFDWFKARGFRLGIASSDSEEAVRAMARIFGIAAHLDFVAGYDSGHGMKPDPGVVGAFCKAMNLRPEQVAVIGDNTHDVGMGRSGGAGLTIGVLTGSGTRETLAPWSDVCLDNISDMKALFGAARR